MGIDMQIVYCGVARTTQFESEAAAQLVRLERFGRSIAGCHLALEAIRERARSDIVGAQVALTDASAERCFFHAHLDLVLRTGELVQIGHRRSLDPVEAVRRAFDAAERFLQGGAARI
ncbi:conserved hypothetical protein [Paraburkholderia ribeironis]|uniref:Metal ABC transporter ATPase n=1 Tax=Paraburkholderia ribeironis TaxID=1247936 RepID=A0A1N7S831_9BURK|nr:hypothetical protein [Paraburkholderia ribeironis]SIT43539.1 conserved hypothetical protein [Paraburkholderia ribeironis]